MVVPEFSNVWAMISPEPFEKPVTLPELDVAVQEKVLTTCDWLLMFVV